MPLGRSVELPVGPSLTNARGTKARAIFWKRPALHLIINGGENSDETPGLPFRLASGRDRDESFKGRRTEKGAEAGGGKRQEEEGRKGGGEAS
eukprot:2277525-Pyramimonas_sp.AAC.1